MIYITLDSSNKLIEYLRVFFFFFFVEEIEYLSKAKTIYGSSSTLNFYLFFIFLLLSYFKKLTFEENRYNISDFFFHKIMSFGYYIF